MNMDIFTGLWNILSTVIHWFQICTFIDPWEEGILVRRGKFNRVVRGGVVWHQPFGQDEILVTNVRPTALELDEQTVTTRDGYTLVCRGVLMWGIFDVKKSMLDVENAQESLGDISVGVLQESIEQQDWVYIQSSEFRKDCLKLMQKQARKWGIGVSKFKFQDLALAKAYKLF